ncbi:hypothetical protein P4O66_015925 [Electrophorus voltai]|uniref:Uncharacterized protein n=1 Tax=Electrophorus voltai TaxID=2609070 RepID=A0AAD8YUG9_9TELE|nr:hypothetical protein P4O66_015925 [Electrophorus voltai]
MMDSGSQVDHHRKVHRLIYSSPLTYIDLNIHAFSLQPQEPKALLTAGFGLALPLFSKALEKDAAPSPTSQ